LSEEGQGQDVIELNKDFLIQYRVHFGRNVKTKFSEKFIYGVHPKGFYLIDVDQTIERSQAGSYLVP